MKNYMKCLFSLVFCVFSPVSGMLVPIQKIERQFLSQDCLKQVQWKCDLQSLGRLAATCSYMNENWKVEDFSPENFYLVEKCLYFYAPKVSLPVLETDPSYNEIGDVKKRLFSVITKHNKSINTSIQLLYSHIKKSEFGPFFNDTLDITHDDKIAFYFGKLPVQKSRDELIGDPLSDDILEAAYEDAKFTIFNRNIDRARVVLNRYEQFANFENGLIQSLCALGNGQILVDYLSIPERGVEYASDPNGLTALEIARDTFEDEELVNFLQQAIDHIETA